MSSLEAGMGNPTIGTIDALAIALRIPITDLLAREVDPGPIIIPATEAEPGEVTRELLRRISGGHSLELWRMRIPPHSNINGLPHATGTVEHLLIASGELTAGSVDSPQTLGPGDMLAFAGDSPHVYRTDDQGVDVTVVFSAPVIT